MSNKINLYRGDNKTYEVEIKDGNGVVVDITSATIKFTVKLSVNDATNQFQLTNSDQSEIEDFDLSNGKFKIHVIPSNTSSMNIEKYIYDIQITLVTKVYTVIKDEFNLKADVTI